MSAGDRLGCFYLGQFAQPIHPIGDKPVDAGKLLASHQYRQHKPDNHE
jgi:hypothetical protein